jgi:hypothetical protein
MADPKNLVRIKELVDNAESALKVAKQLLAESMGLTEGSGIDTESYKAKAAAFSAERAVAPAPTTTTVEGRVIEGVFDGQNMVDEAGNTYPVPANYASKSKLIPGDVLKLTITEEGKFLYKQIGPVERKTVVGPLVYNNGRYQILANNKADSVLLASVTYYRAEVGDDITLIIPMNEEADWGAIEAVLPKFGDTPAVTTTASAEEEEEKKEEEEEEKPKKRGRKKKEIDLDEELDI